MDMQEQYELWTQFLKEWPITRLEAMTLEEYTKAGSTNTFTYWIESKLDKMGSIWGGSAFKFGIYSRKNDEIKETSSGRSYSEKYGWYTRLGNTETTAFETVRSAIVEIAKNALNGHLDAIEKSTFLGDAVKWKIAFHYQNRSHPTIINIFKPEALSSYLNIENPTNFLKLQKQIITQKPNHINILEFAHKVWSEWKQKMDKSIKIWKISHGISEGEKYFTTTQLEEYRKNRVIVMNINTKDNQGSNFRNAPIGSIFYLCYSTNVKLLGRITSEADECPDREEGWLQRKYEEIAITTNNKPFQSTHHEKWSPKGISTFYEIKNENLKKFETELLYPYFNLSLEQLLSKDSNSNNLSNQDKKESTNNLFTNTIFYGPPGTGKTHKLGQLLQNYTDQSNEHAELRKRYEFVTFHQSYGYEEFVEGLRPVLNNNNANGQVEYEIRAGVFKKLCEQARRHPKYQFVMVIDEINRGNISKIFGELITLIEADKRAGMPNEIQITLPYSGESFSVPKNIDIIGTMNTADRSLALLDTALRRRFHFVPMLPKTDLLKDINIENINIQTMLEAINQRIEVLYDREHCIGHAYFMPLEQDRSLEKLQDIMRNQILPLLEEYFFDDWEKIRLILADDAKSEESQFIQVSNISQNLFKNPDLVIDKTRFIINEDAFWLPKSYQRIYE